MGKKDDTLREAARRARETELNGDYREAQAIRRDMATASPDERVAEKYGQSNRRVVENPTKIAPQDGEWYFDGDDTIEL